MTGSTHFCPLCAITGKTAALTVLTRATFGDPINYECSFCGTMFEHDDMIQTWYELHQNYETRRRQMQLMQRYHLE